MIRRRIFPDIRTPFIPSRLSNMALTSYSGYSLKAYLRINNVTKATKKQIQRNAGRKRRHATGISRLSLRVRDERVENPEAKKQTKHRTQSVCSLYRHGERSE